MNTNEKDKKNDQKIIFFDGVCHLCNHFVDFLIRSDPKHQFMFAPLQGETAQKMLPSTKIQQLNSVIYYENGEIFEKSEAILKVFKLLPYPYKLISTSGRLVPGSAGDLIYELVAKNRYNWFGEKDSCRIPSNEEKAQFLAWIWSK